MTAPPFGGHVGVWFSDAVAHDHDVLVEECVAWLQSFKGVHEAWREDPEVIVVLGPFSHRELERQVRGWWGGNGCPELPPSRHPGAGHGPATLPGCGRSAAHGCSPRSKRNSSARRAVNNGLGARSEAI